MQKEQLFTFALSYVINYYLLKYNSYLLKIKKNSYWYYRYESPYYYWNSRDQRENVTTNAPAHKMGSISGVVHYVWRFIASKKCRQFD